MPTPASQKSTLWVLALIMLINALSYGIIIPLMYPLVHRFGLGPTALSWLIASFSLAQFIATPVIGRLSDRFGRKPLLLLCVLGSGLSMALLAVAGNPVVLFLARIIDGVTGGNNSVAQAAIADSTTGPQRTKAFGLLGAAFGFGFLFGPAIGGLLGQVSLSAPFWFASLLSLIATGLGWFFLAETLAPEKKRAVKLEYLFHGKQLLQALATPLVGILLLTTLVTSAAQTSFIVGIQTVSFDIFKFTTQQFGFMLGAVGLVSVIMQAGVIRVLLRLVKRKEWLLVGAMLGAALVLVAMSLLGSVALFVGWNTIFTVFLSIQAPVISSLISERTQAEDQGFALGLNQAYMSLGMIIGPLLAGLVALTGLPHIFLLSASLLGVGLIGSRWLFVRAPKLDL